jgi:hypothetical protein
VRQHHRIVRRYCQRIVERKAFDIRPLGTLFNFPMPPRPERIHSPVGACLAAAPPIERRFRPSPDVHQVEGSPSTASSPLKCRGFQSSRNRKLAAEVDDSAEGPGMAIAG